MKINSILVWQVLFKPHLSLLQFVLLSCERVAACIRHRSNSVFLIVWETRMISLSGVENIYKSSAKFTVAGSMEKTVREYLRKVFETMREKLELLARHFRCVLCRETCSTALC